MNDIVTSDLHTCIIEWKLYWNRAYLPSWENYQSNYTCVIVKYATLAIPGCDIRMQFHGYLFSMSRTICMEEYGIVHIIISNNSSDKLLNKKRSGNIINIITWMWTLAFLIE